jgi:hypothetical protein
LRRFVLPEYMLPLCSSLLIVKFRIPRDCPYFRAEMEFSALRDEPHDSCGAPTEIIRSCDSVNSYDEAEQLQLVRTSSILPVHVHSV